MLKCKWVCPRPPRPPRQFTAKDVKRIINKVLETDTVDNVCKAIDESMPDDECKTENKKLNCGDNLKRLIGISTALKKTLNNSAIQSVFNKLVSLQEFGKSFWDNVFSIGGLIKQFYPQYEENNLQPVFLPALIPPAAILSNAFGILSLAKFVMDKLESMREMVNLMLEVSEILEEVIGIMLEKCEHDYNENMITTDPILIDDQGNLINFDSESENEGFI